MSITKTKKKNKDGVFQYRVRVSYQTADGSYKQREKAVWGLASAKEVEHNLSQQETHTVKKILLSELITEYLSVKKYEVRETSLQTSNGRIERYISPTLSNCRIDKLTPKVITDWKLLLEEKNLSFSTKKATFSELRAILNYAVRLDYLPNNPLLKVGNFKTGDIQEKNIQVYTPEEFKKYIAIAKENAIANNYYDFYVFFNIAYYTGMRKGEIHSLKWSNYINGIIHIKASIAQKIKGIGYVESQPKNKGSIRSIQIPKPLIDILSEHKKLQMLQPNFSEDRYICGFDKPLSDTGIDLKNRYFAENAGLHRIRIHDFRHTHASILIDAGVAITEIARRLGHSDIKETLNTYSHFFPTQEEKAISILNNI